MRQLKNKGKDQLVIPEVVVVAYGSRSLTKGFDHRVKMKIQQGFTMVFVTIYQVHMKSSGHNSRTVVHFSAFLVVLSPRFVGFFARGLPIPSGNVALLFYPLLSASFYAIMINQAKHSRNDGFLLQTKCKKAKKSEGQWFLNF